MRIGLVLAMLMLSACVLGGDKGGQAKAPPVNPIMGEAIATTSLDAAPGTAKPDMADRAVASDPAEKPKTDTTEVAEKAAPEAVETAPEPPPEPQSPAEAKCLKSGGLWSKAGEGSAQACVKRTKDAGKRCTKQTQCEGLCLARSGTCAPITPMFGCNDILQADGRMVTLCLD